MIIIRIWEGLGNQLFQYAYAKALQEQGYEVYLDVNHSFPAIFKNYRLNAIRKVQLEAFHIDLPFMGKDQYKKLLFLECKNSWDKVRCLLARKRIGKYKYYIEDGLGYNECLAHMKDNYYIQGTFQSTKYFERIVDSLKNDLTLKDDFTLPNHLSDFLNRGNVVSVHIRRGDYVKLNHSLNRYYYIQAIQKAKELIENPVFMVFSDDIGWVKENIPFDSEVRFVSDECDLQDYEELILMSRCNHNIISNSTFSWWAAFLNANENKKVLAPKVWFHNQEELLQEDWIIV